MHDITHTNHDSDSVWRVGLRTFFKITNLWALTQEQQAILLGIQDCDALASHCDSVFIEPLNSEAMIRVSYVLGIYKQLNTLLPIPSHADGWLKKQNSEELFKGNSALEFLLKDPASHLPLLLAYLKTVTVDF